MDSNFFKIFFAQSFPGFRINIYSPLTEILSFNSFRESIRKIFCIFVDFMAICGAISKWSKDYKIFKIPFSTSCKFGFIINKVTKILYYYINSNDYMIKHGKPPFLYPKSYRLESTFSLYPYPPGLAPGHQSDDCELMYSSQLWKVSSPNADIPMHLRMLTLHKLW